MEKPSSHAMLLVFFWFLNLHFITCFSLTLNNTSAHLCSYDEGRALMEFKSSFTISSYVSGFCSLDSPKRTNSWNEGQDCCYWDGVTCDTTTGQVIGLDLSCSGLQGRLTSNSSLFLLEHLQTLNLGYNDFTGTIHPKFSKFQKLTHLNLDYSQLSGEVPIEISYLSNLISLHLSSDIGYLTLPGLAMKSIVQNLTNLKELNLDGVDLSSVESNSLRNISSSLTSLVLGGLTGIFPTSIFHLPNLQLLHLSGYGYNSMDFLVYLPTSNWSTISLRELEFRYIIFKNGLPSSIGDLKSLNYLDISRCGITGSIPDSIGNLTSLEYLSLTANELVGTMPPSLAYLARLQHLDLSDNELVGSVPIFSNLSLLNTLNLYFNSLTGTIPFSIYSLPLLRNLELFDNQFTGGKLHPFQSMAVERIDLRNCSLQGPIPAILFPYGANQLATLNLRHNQLVGGIPEFKSTSLKELDLSNNKLQGNIPSSISDLANLTRLDFSSNDLSGKIDTSKFSKLQSLTYLDGSYNRLSFTTNVSINHSLLNLVSFDFSFNNLTDFPVFLRSSRVLSELRLSNNKIDGRVPDWLWDVGRDTLEYLDLAHNSLTRIDKLPWMNLRNLDLRFNLLRGPLPLPPQSLVTYYISHNSLTGYISTLICKTSSMEVLDLSRNNFSGTIPKCLGNIFTLEVLDLSMNRLHGRIPNFFGHEKRSLSTLNLNGNQLEGKLSRSLVNCEELEVLDIGNNIINDTFPHWLRFLTELKVLILTLNNFHGYIHDYKYQQSFQKLRIFDISNNNFVGSLPTKYIQGLEAMKHDMLVGTEYSNYMGGAYYGFGNSNYEDSVTLTIKGSEIRLEKILTKFMTIDLSKNMFGGEIPQVFGTLISLKSLNLSHNNLVGHIPTSIGNLTNLESLDLSSNKLSGTIPRELASLTFLGKLNLSQNALVGPIPSANIFDTRFDNSSYQENLALCGPPLSRTCSNKNNKKPPPALDREEDSDDFDKKIILYGYISGLVIGLSIGYMVFSGELPIWFIKMIQHYQLKKLKRQIQLSRTRN